MDVLIEEIPGRAPSLLIGRLLKVQLALLSQVTQIGNAIQSPQIIQDEPIK